MLLKTLQLASLDFCHGGSSSSEASVLFSPLFCLCLQGWPMNRQLHKGPSFYSAFPSADGGHLNTQPMEGGVALFPAWVHVRSGNSCHHQLSPVSFSFFRSTVQNSTTRVCLGLSVYFK